MRKIFLLAIATAFVVAVGAAAAKTVTVTITKNGFVANSTALVPGDTVQFTNSDTVAHQVTFKSMTGVTCSPNPLVLQPGSSGSCTFKSSGTFTYSDPNMRGNTFRGTITVAAASGSLSISAKPVLITYGSQTVLAGKLSSPAVGENVDVFAQSCGTPAATKTATVQTTAGGAYSASVKPLMRTAYTTKSRALTSSVVNVRVRPRIRLAKVAAHRYSVRVRAARSFAGKYASFQRYSSTLHRWVAVRRVLLKANSTGVAPTVLTTRSFRSSIRGGRRVRITLPQTQVGSCYAPGLSNSVLS
jgi:plastocyanin